MYTAPPSPRRQLAVRLFPRHVDDPDIALAKLYLSLKLAAKMTPLPRGPWKVNWFRGNTRISTYRQGWRERPMHDGEPMTNNVLQACADERAARRHENMSRLAASLSRRAQRLASVKPLSSGGPQFGGVSRE